MRKASDRQRGATGTAAIASSSRPRRDLPAALLEAVSLCEELEQQSARVGELVIIITQVDSTSIDLQRAALPAAFASDCETATLEHLRGELEQLVYTREDCFHTPTIYIRLQEVTKYS